MGPKSPASGDECTRLGTRIKHPSGQVIGKAAADHQIERAILASGGHLPDYIKKILSSVNAERMAISKYTLARRFHKTHKWEDN